MTVELPASVRLVADGATFRAWLEGHPLITGPADSGGAAAGPLPPAVAAALAVQVAAEVSVSVRTWTPEGGTLTFAALSGDLGSSVSCEGVPPPEPVAAEGARVRLWPPGSAALAEGAVEVALFPATQLVGEVFRGVPANPSTVTGPLATGLQVAVAGAEDAVACWQETLLAGGGRWRRVLPPDLVHLVEDADSPAEGILLDPVPRTLHALSLDLRYVVTGCLERTWSDDPPP